MKKITVLCLTIIFVTLTAVLLVVSADTDRVTVTLDGKEVNCESYGSPATIVDGRTLVPLRAIFEALGASVEWDGSTKTVTSELDGTEIKLTVGESTLYKNGNAVTLDVPATIINDRTMVPARAIAESFGVKVEWDSKTRTVILLTDTDKGYACVIEKRSDETDLSGISVFRARANVEIEENGNAYAVFKGIDHVTSETDFFINYTGKEDVVKKGIIMSIKVKPDDSVSSIIFATGGHVHVSESVTASQLIPEKWNKLTLIYKPDEKSFDLYINDKFMSSKNVELKNNTLRILFKFAGKIGDSRIEFDDYCIYSGKMVFPAVTSEKYIIENLTVNGTGSDTAEQILENLTPGIEGYKMIIKDKNGNIAKGSDKIDNKYTLSVLDKDLVVAEYGFNSGTLIFENAKIAAGNYVLPTDEYGEGDVTFSTDYRNLGENTDVKFSAVLYGNDGKALKKINEAAKEYTLEERGTLSVSMNIKNSNGTYVEINVFDAKTGKQLCAPIAFNGNSNEKISYAMPLYQGYTTKAVCFNYDDAVWQDTIFVELLNKYGLKATFNLMGSNILSNVGNKSGKSSDAEKFEFVKNLYFGHEISNHSMTHIPACFDEGEIGHNSAGVELVGKSFEELIKDTLDCPIYIKENLGAEAIGIAWPQGYATSRSDYETKILPAIRDAGLKYARAAENGTFKLPADWYEWNATCHHRDAVKYTETFIALENSGELKCFFIWGHSYEFENNKNNPELGWTMIEGVMQDLSAQDDIWSATNGDIYRYVEATKLVEIGEKTVKNNSDMTVYFNVNGKNVEIDPGKTYTIE